MLARVITFPTERKRDGFFVDAGCIDQLREDIDQILNENTYKVEDPKQEFVRADQ